MANQTGSQCGEDQDELQSSSSCSSEIGEPLARASERRSSLALHSEVEKIFGWLGSTSKPQVEAEAKIERRPTRRTLNVGDCRIEDSGYENCLNLQRQLRATRCRSIGNLFESVVHDQLASPAPDRHDGKRLQLHRASLQPLTAPRRMFTPESSSLSNSSDSLMQQQEEQRAETGPYQTLLSEAPKRKEILLKVVVDESSQSPGGDEVFYITPTVSF